MLVNITKKTQWNNILNRIEEYDFYHTYDYHNFSKREGETANLIVYTEDDIIIALPLLFRRIPNSVFFDATSIYGYGGPLQKNISKSFDNSNYVKSLFLFLNKNKIISVFSRLNPFINNQEVILKNLGEIKTIGSIVNIDLTKNTDDQRSCFSKTTKRYINKYKKQFEFRTGINDEDIETFKNIYYENMDRVNAKKNYYFNSEYLKNILNSNEYQAELIFAIIKKTNEVAAGAIVVRSNKIVQYHISGTKNKFLYLTPIRHIIDETRIASTYKNFKYFNLGGGLGNKMDELFRFKASFSKDFKSFKIWNCIINNKVYIDLVNKSNFDSKKNYFPLYRKKEL